MLMTATELQEHLLVASDMSEPELFNFPEGRVAAYCRRCPNKMSLNQDSAAVIRFGFGSLVLAIADGVGGGRSGMRASAVALRALSDSLLKVSDPGDLRSSIVDGIECANANVLGLGVGAATTLSVVEINQSMARAYQVGDSTSLVFGQRGSLKWKSISQSPVGYAIESGILEERDAMLHPDRHLVSNLVGSREMHIELGPAQELNPRDTVLVGSDGVFDNLHLDEVLDLGRSGEPRERVRDLAHLAHQRMVSMSSESIGKPDDLSVLLYSR